MGLAHTVHQQAGGAEDAGPQRQPAADLAFEIIGDPTADGVDIVKVFAQAAARMGDSVWVGYVADGQPVACRVRVGNHPVHSGGDRASFAVAFDAALLDRKSTRLNSSHVKISYAVFCLKKKKNEYEYY